MIVKIEAGIPGGATTNSVATTDVQNSGIITGVLMGFRSISALDLINDFIGAELSFMSSNTFGVNDVRGSIAMNFLEQQFLTTGGGIGNVVLAISGLAIEVNAGERIHLHATASSGTGGNVWAYLYIADGVGIDRSRPARRNR